MTATADLAIVIPSHGRWDRLVRTLGALVPQAGDADVVVVLDGDDLDPPDLPVGRIVQVPSGGPSAARNAGVADTDRPLVLFLGDDMVPTSGLVAAHLRAHDDEPDERVAVLGHVDWHPEIADDPILRWLDWSGTQFDYVSLRAGGATRSPTRTDAGFGRFYSCNVSLKRALLDTAGGFDPAFTFAYEDLDLGWRLHQHGLVLRYEPDAVVHHLHAYTMRDVVRRFEAIAVGERLMAAKHDWFDPFFRRRVLSVAYDPPVPRWWTHVADRLGRAPASIRQPARNRANAWYLQHVGPTFLDAWANAGAVEELRDHLGADFDETALRDHVARVEAEEAAAPDDATFYRTSRAYLYDLTAFALSGTKAPYLRELRRLVRPPASLLDYGCGIGSDGLQLLDEGYRVHFADFANPSTDYLRWRLGRRGVTAPVHDVESDVPGGHDLVYCFDVVEHVADPVAFLERLESLGAVVLVNLLEPAPGDTHVHKPLDIAALRHRARTRGIIHESVEHGRSHLLAYRGTSI